MRPPCSAARVLPPAVDRACTSLNRLGLDLIAAFDVASYNAVAESHKSLHPVGTFGRQSALALLIGNTRKLWPLFIAAIESDPHPRSGDPLDNYVKNATRSSFGTFDESRKATSDVRGDRSLETTSYHARFASDVGELRVSMLHAASVSGLAHVGPAHLAIHPTHGPWFGLRALLVFDLPAGRTPKPAPNPCVNCGAPCQEALASALKMASDEWTRWVAIRDVCPVGTTSRYGPHQLRYHYTKDHSALRLDSTE